MQLSAWTSATEKAVITAAEILPSAPDAAGEEGGGVAPKGYQQITGWQVRGPCCGEAGFDDARMEIGSLCKS